ncbi:hypothetical protein QWY16_11595 [Planococcus shenhongbingii]|uniref:hypothetical protein n=1 Tax=Planococcus shenhongbingii TaxID=3058398 RepID=UPI0026270FAE|nr:hypothetical protein [Planococcus sp. N016]WKA57144.1 hypothetical protein QWY16_11595 [Planococcus sp. N016]
MDNRQDIKDSFNNSTYGNLNVKGDNVKQQNINIRNKDQEKAFLELFDYINSLEDESKKVQAHYNAEELKLAIEEGNDTKAKKLFGFLQSSLGNISALITIGQFAGLPPLI